VGIRRTKPDARADRDHRLTFHDRQLKQAGHRHVACAVLHAAEDAGNRWTFTDRADDGLVPHAVVGAVLNMGSSERTKVAG
jgi:hypothetical protein